MTKYQSLYWETQRIQDELFKLERTVKRLQQQGKRYVNAQNQYYELLYKLREMQSQMNLFERCAA